MELPLGSRCVKYLMFIFNLFFVFTTLLLVVLGLEIGGGISAYILRANASSIIQEKMKDAMQMYNRTEAAANWNIVQHDFHCCGTNGPSDWKDIFPNNTVPTSCCDVKMGVNETCTVNSPTIHHDGCFQTFVSFIKSHYLQLGSVGLGIAFVQGLGIAFSIYLARSIKNSYESV
ncbi:unnamed protein product [Xylocopa violacea]|uniref:Tetraspanin n=1 Tax=Xylocopa violacea TaxID=135666 RepID=A0ABP1P7P5_XYLVO